VIDGLVGLGSDIGDCVHLDKLSVIPEGTQVLSETYVSGNPALDRGREFQGNDGPCTRILFKLLQMLWLIFEVYLFFWLFMVSKLFLSGLLTTSWRFSVLMYWILALITTSFIALIVSAGLKWLMIGRRREGTRRCPSVLVSFSEWACDYHYKVSTSIFFTALPTSRVWNVILMLHGLDVDLRSGFSNVHASPPSVVDRLFIRRSFLGPWISFRSGERIEIVDSTIGLRAVLQSGIQIHRSTILAFGEAETSVYDTFTKPTKETLVELLVSEGMAILRFLLLCVSSLPAFEVYGAIGASGWSIHHTLSGIVALIATLCVSLWVLTWFTQAIALMLLQKARSSMPGVFARSWYYLYIHVVLFNNNWGHWFLLWGSPFYNGLASSLGAKIKGNFLFNGRGQHDFHALAFEDKTIVDDCHVTGHIQIGKELRVGPSVHCGVLHEGCVTVSGTVMEGSFMKETGPMRALLGQTGTTGTSFEPKSNVRDEISSANGAA